MGAIDIVQPMPVCRVCGQEGLCNCPLCVEAKGGQLNMCAPCARSKMARKGGAK